MAEGLDTAADIPDGKRRALRGSRGAYAKSADRRDRILAAALQVFTRLGYNSGTVRAVARQANMAEATVLHHFPSKNALLAALLEQREMHTRASLTTATDALEALFQAVDLDDGQTRTYAELLTRLAAEATDSEHPAHEFVVRRYDTVREELTESFTDLDRQGRLQRGVSPSSAARLTIAAWEGLLLQWLLDNRTVDVRAEMRSLIRLFVDSDQVQRRQHCAGSVPDS
ncbi:TetR/AcrR family transcriptional regulator [Mycobacterium sp. SMC-11]|uniref:TetR/AcrR family transcriptional regulator n=1 Tax=Mycobacterium sp. SMC-11 TaxID=3385969 RepID=UPI00390CAC06